MPKADFSSPGSAIAYSAYSFPDTLVCTTFRDYYVTLAVLNTIFSTGLSCYSRYLAALSGDGERALQHIHGLWEGTVQEALGAWASVPRGLPVAGQERPRGHRACAVAQGP